MIEMAVVVADTFPEAVDLSKMIVKRANEVIAEYGQYALCDYYEDLCNEYADSFYEATLKIRGYNELLNYGWQNFIDHDDVWFRQAKDGKWEVHLPDPEPIN